MKTLKEGITKLDQADEAVQIMRSKQAEIRREFIEKFAPHAMGSVIVVNGYAYKGKSMRVSSIAITENTRAREFHYHGRVLRKDGSESGYHADSHYDMNGKPSRGR